MKTIARSIVAVLLLALALAVLPGCQSAEQKLDTAQKGVTLAQNTWTQLLTDKVITDRTTIAAGTSAIDFASNEIGKAEQARQTASTQPANTDLRSTFEKYADKALAFMEDAKGAISDFLAEKAKTK